MAKLIRESFGLEDKLAKQPSFPPQKSSMFARTQILGGYGIRRDNNGITSLGETAFDEHNMIPIGACQYVFEQLAGVSGPLNVPTLYTVSNGAIGIPDVSITDYAQSPYNEKVTYDIPALQGDDQYKSIIHPNGETLCLFGVGITGSATNTLTKPDVKYQEYSIQNSLAVENDQQLQGVMIPFRYTSAQLSTTDRVKYFGKTDTWTSETVDNIGYYLKRFEGDPEIKNFWKAAEDDIESTNEFVQAEYYPRTQTINSGSIETYLEMILKITSKDIKQWFAATDNIDHSRINTIALFTGRYNAALGDYENVRMFSKLTIPVENLSLSKDFDIIYRIYSA